MVDLDNIFKYAAPKYIYIRDKKLGILKYIFMVAILFYVVIYGIFIECEHLKPHHATGFGSMSLGVPDSSCDPYDAECEAAFDTIYKLPYCAQYKGDELQPPVKGKIERRLDSDSSSEGSDTKSDIGSKISQTRNCRYVDNLRLTWEPSVMSEIFIPTRFKQIKQTLNPDCYDPEADTDSSGGGDGADKYECTKAYNTEVTNDWYVADIGEYRLALEHTFNCPTLGEYGSSADLQGFFAACPVNKPMTTKEVKANCKRMKVPASEGDVAPEDLAGLLNATDAGCPSLKYLNGFDVINLQDLLKLTPIAQHEGWTDDVLDRKFPIGFGHPDESLREVGGMLMLEVSYDNTAYYRPGFGTSGMLVKPITYTYRASFVPTAENYKYQVVQKGDRSKDRVVDIWYGISIRMTFNGELVKFQFAKLLTALTTGLVLLSSASTLVLYLAAYVLPLAEKYGLLLYQLSEDFTDYSHLKAATAVSSQHGKSAKSMYWVGNLLLKKLEAKEKGGNWEVDQKELKAILTTTEMRLNRMDAMDIKVTFDDGNERDSRLYEIGNWCKKFYLEHIPKEEIALMSYKLQEDRREPIPTTDPGNGGGGFPQSDPNLLGKLKGS